MTDQCELFSDHQSCLLEDLDCKLLKYPIVTQLPFNQIKDDAENDIFNADDNLISIGGLKTQDMPRLMIFDDCQSSKPLINNIDIDPDENNYETRPVEHGYSTPSQLSRKLGTVPHFCSYMHVNCRSIVPKMSNLR